MEEKNKCYWKTSCIILIPAVLIFCGIPRGMAVPAYKVTQLTSFDSTESDQNPQINDNNQVVWERTGNFGGIILYTPPVRSGDLPELVLIASNSGSDIYSIATTPKINSSGEVAFNWLKPSAVSLYDSQWDLFLHLSYGDPLVRISYTPDVGDGTPALNDDGHIVWRGGFLDNSIPDQHIFCWDGCETWLVTSDDYVNRSAPVLSNSGAFFWHEESSGGINRIQMSTVNNPNVVTTVVENVVHLDPVNDLAVKSRQMPYLGWRFNQTFLVWSEHGGAAFDTHQIILLRWSPYSIWPPVLQQITDADNDQRYPQVNAQGQVVWEGIEFGTSHIYLYDRGSSTRISPTDSLNNHYPQINDRGVVTWYGKSMFFGMPGNYAIFVRSSNGQILRISNPNFDNLNPKINNNGRIVWEGCSGPNFSKRIYLGVPPGLAYGFPRYQHRMGFPR